MIKFIILSLLSIALFGPVHSKITESNLGEDGYSLVIDIDDNRPCEDKCLATKNSKKISNAILHVLHAANNSYNVLADLRVIEFIYGIIDYKEFADNIKQNNFNYVGYTKLQNLVNRYRVCKKVCKVYSQLRKALKANAGSAPIYENDNPDGTKNIEVDGTLCILADLYRNLEAFLAQDPTYGGVNFNCQIFIADVNLEQGVWAGVNITVASNVTIVPLPFVTWDVTAITSTYNIQHKYLKMIKLFFFIKQMMTAQRLELMEPS